VHPFEYLEQEYIAIALKLAHTRNKSKSKNLSKSKIRNTLAKTGVGSLAVGGFRFVVGVKVPEWFIYLSV